MDPLPAANRASRPLTSAPRILHVIEQLRLGGPAHALIGAGKHSRAAGFHHRVASLLPPDARATRLAATAGIDVINPADASALYREIDAAEVVQLHFWNSPEIHAFIESDLPPMRLLAWCHANGHHAPHIIPRALFTFADLVVATTASTLDLPAFRVSDPSRVDLIAAGADFSRLDGVQPAAHTGFTVGYIGQVDFGKLHAGFVRMSAAVEVPTARFLVCGDGGARTTLERQARECERAEDFVFVDYTEDIRSIVSQLDVFGYPLCPENYSTSELVLQEVMYAGVPPVVLPHGGASRLVVDGETGIVARDESAYARAIERLFRAPVERRRLGRNAARYARDQFGAEVTARKLNTLYARLLQQPKKPRQGGVATARAPRQQVPGESRGAWALVRSLDGVGDIDFIASLSAPSDTEARAAEARVPLMSPSMTHTVLRYRFRYPDDAHLRLWSGLILARERRPALAAAEFKASLDLGCVEPRVHRYFAESARVARS